MSIITRADCKVLLRISTGTTDYNSLIDTLIPIVQEDVAEICNNEFFLRDVYVVGTGIAFTTSTGGGDKITDSSSGFLDDDHPFVASQDIVVNGSKHNDGFYELASVSSGTLTLDSSGDVIAEAADEYIKIAQVKWPKGIKPTVAKMIWYHIENNKAPAPKSEGLGGYSVQHEDSIGGYPGEIIEGLRPWMMVKMS